MTEQQARDDDRQELARGHDCCERKGSCGGRLCSATDGRASRDRINHNWTQTRDCARTKFADRIDDGELASRRRERKRVYFPERPCLRPVKQGDGVSSSPALSMARQAHSRESAGSMNLRLRRTRVAP